APCEVLEVLTFTMWCRMDNPPSLPLFIACAYAPVSAREQDRSRFWSELRQSLAKYRALGIVVVGGDFNGRLAVNGDTVTNAAGEEILDFATAHGLTILNKLPSAKGSFSFFDGTKANGPRQSTVDYILADDCHASL